jgi:hypothetical protein
MTTSKKVLSCFVIHSLYVNLANFIPPKKIQIKQEDKESRMEKKEKGKGPRLTQ